jgi:hypothetical protein
MWKVLTNMEWNLQRSRRSDADKPSRTPCFVLSPASEAVMDVLCWASWFRRRTGSGSPAHRRDARTDTGSTSGVSPSDCFGIPGAPSEFSYVRASHHCGLRHLAGPRLVPVFASQRVSLTVSVEV